MSPPRTLVEHLEPRRLLAAAGDLDPTFGVDGVVVYNDIPAPAVGVATQSDGKFLVATGATIYRFRPDGLLDKSFGHRGHVTPGFGIFGLGIDHQGRIAVGGGNGGRHGRNPQWAAARYTPTGAPDTSFNGTGQIVTHVNGPDEVTPSVMALQPDGKILIGGTRYHPTTNNPYDEYDMSAVIVRFDTDGSIDTAFGTNGQALDTHLFNAVDTIALAPNGDIALAGREDLGMSIHDEHYQVVNSAGQFVTGTPDNTFGFGGSQVIDLNRRKFEQIDRLALLSNGDYLAVGSIGVQFADNNGQGGDPGQLFVAHIKGGTHPVGDLAPRARSVITPPEANATQLEFTVAYAAEESIDASTPDNRDVRVRGPGGYSALAHLSDLATRYAGRQRIATYTIDAPGGTWNRSDNGRYTLYLRPNQVIDNRVRPVPAQILGGFKVHFLRTQTAPTPIRSLSPLTTPAQRRKRDDISDLLA